MKQKTGALEIVLSAEKRAAEHRKMVENKMTARTDRTVRIFELVEKLAQIRRGDSFLKIAGKSNNRLNVLRKLAAT